MAKEKMDYLALMDMLEQNEVRLGGQVTKKFIMAGKQKTTKEGQPLFNEQTGEPLRWDDSYYIEFTFKGGVSNFKVDLEAYNNVIESERCVMVGKVISKTPFNGGKPYLSVEARKFEKIDI